MSLMIVSSPIAKIPEISVCNMNATMKPPTPLTIVLHAVKIPTVTRQILYVLVWFVRTLLARVNIRTTRTIYVIFSSPNGPFLKT